MRGFLVTVATTAFASFLFAPGALASKTHVDSLGASAEGTTGGLFAKPLGVAVNQSGAGGVPAGTFYVADSENNRVQQFSPTGSFVRTWGWGVSTETAQFEICATANGCKKGLSGAGPGQLNKPQGVAVDQSNGNLYVTDQGNRRVDIFNAGGLFEGAFGWGVSTGSAAFEFCTVFTPCRAPNTTAPAGGQAGKFGTEIGFPAVDPTSGGIHVADISNRRVDVFTPTLSGTVVTGVSFTRAFGWDVSTVAGAAFEVCTGANCKAPGSAGTNPGRFGTKSPTEVALDSSGNIYALDPGNNRVQKFDSTPTPVDAAFGSTALATAFGTGAVQNLAVDPSASPNHVLVAGTNSANQNRIAVAELDATGAGADSHGAGLTSTTSAGLAVAAEALGGNIYLSSSRPGFEQFVHVLNAAPTVNPVTTFAGTSATFTGTVVSNNFETTYHFEYSIDGTNWTSFPIPDANAGSAATTIPVAQEVKGLTGSQLYRVRLVSNRPAGGGSATSSETTFETTAAAPAISGSNASQVSDTTATLNANLNSQNQTTTYRFEFVDDANFQATGYANAIAFPVPGDTLGAGPGAVAIGRDVGGLQPATTYHFRVVATNSTGTTEGEEGKDLTFTTYPAPEGGLPDNRAYELVSLPDTNGFPATALGLGEDGGFPTALSAPAGDSLVYLINGSLPGSEGNGVIDQYRAVRNDQGWTSELISPSGAQARLPLAGGVAPDHRYAFWATSGKSKSGVDDGTLDLGTTEGTRYVRNPDGTFELIGEGSLGTDPNAKGKWITAGATHVIFTSNSQLEPNAPAAPGTGTDPTTFGQPAVGAIYDRTPVGTHVASLLPGDVTPPPGSNTFYEGVSADGSAVAFLVDTTLYVRRDNATTIEVAGSSPKFAGLSQNGDRVFYFRRDGSENPERGDIFAFDLDSATTTPIAIGGATFINVSADGSHAYFVSTEQLDGANGTDGANNLYVWDGATVRFIAILDLLDLRRFDEFGLMDLGLWTDVVGPVQNPNVGPGSNPSRSTPDGEVFVFQSHAPLTSYDSEGHSEVFRYDAGDESLVCVSCSPIDAPPVEDAHLVLSGFLDPQAPTGAQSIIPNVTSDGEMVFFQSADALVPGDVNGRFDVYEWRDGKVSLISSGHSSAPSYLYGMTPDGHSVFFRTREALLSEDQTAAAGAIYSARIGGGFPSSPATSPCIEEACQGTPSPPPSLPSAASESFQGPGRELGRRCPKGKRQVKRGAQVRCVPARCPKGKRRIKRGGHVRCLARHDGKARSSGKSTLNFGGVR